MKIKTLLLLSSCLFVAGCFGNRTINLIEYIDPEGMVVVTKDQFQGVSHKLDANDYIKLNNGNYLVHKHMLRTLGDYTVIVAAAPITITIDSVMYVIEGVAKSIQNSYSSKHGPPTSVTIPLDHIF